jgi:carbonic anhydrase
MKSLIDGYRRFRTGAWPNYRELYQRLAAGGQSPKTMIIACADSRVDPQMIFDAGPGELFVARNVANLVPPFERDAAYHGTSAAVEFAVRVLEVRDLVVMGHGLCGGVRALLEGTPPTGSDFVTHWVDMARPARDRAIATGETGEELQRTCEHECVKLSLANLLSFPWIAERVAAGKLTLHGCWFAVASGRLMLLDENGRFAPPAEGDD